MKPISKPYMAILLLAVALFSTSCRSSSVTTTTEARTETRTETTSGSTRDRELVFVHDSIVIYVGDTVTKEVWRTRWRDRTVHDTVREHVIDTVRETRTIDKVVEVPVETGGEGKIAALALAAIMAAHIIITKHRLNNH